MIIRPASLGLSYSVDPTASALRAVLRPALFVSAHREPDVDEQKPALRNYVPSPTLRDAA
jgi:hypothetical protein